jgi:amidase
LLLVTRSIGLPQGLDEDDVAFAGVAGASELLASGAVTSPQLVALSLSRIARLDGRLNAFVAVFDEQARRDAAAAQAARDAGDDRPLLGIPIAIKDNMPIAGHASRHGTSSSEPVAAEDAEAVRRIREAGMVIVGVTALPELALWPFTESHTSGPTRNPWSTARSAGGSSGGSAAAVAAGMVPVATAGDGGGSIRIPAACCGLVGLKPQRDRVAPPPADQLWRGLSHVGFLTRSVRDTALLLDVTAGPAPGEVSGPEPWEQPLAASLDAGPRRLRIAWSDRPPAPARLDPLVRGALHSTLTLLREAGHHVERRDPPYGELQSAFVPRYLRAATDSLDALADPQALEPRTRAVARLGRAIPRPVIDRALRRSEEITSRLAGFFDDVDVLVTPLLASPPLPVGRYRNRSATVTLLGAAQFVPFTPPWNLTGQPAMSVPAGHAPDGVPLAVQLVARQGAEATLLSVAAELEAARDWTANRPPLAGA